MSLSILYSTFVPFLPPVSGFVTITDLMLLKPVYGYHIYVHAAFTI